MGNGSDGLFHLTQQPVVLGEVVLAPVLSPLKEFLEYGPNLKERIVDHSWQRTGLRAGIKTVDWLSSTSLSSRVGLSGILGGVRGVGVRALGGVGHLDTIGNVGQALFSSDLSIPQRVLKASKEGIDGWAEQLVMRKTIDPVTNLLRINKAKDWLTDKTLGRWRLTKDFVSDEWLNPTTTSTASEAAEAANVVNQTAPVVNETVAAREVVQAADATSDIATAAREASLVTEVAADVDIASDVTNAARQVTTAETVVGDLRAVSAANELIAEGKPLPSRINTFNLESGTQASARVIQMEVAAPEMIAPIEGNAALALDRADDALDATEAVLKVVPKEGAVAAELNTTTAVNSLAESTTLRNVAATSDVLAATNTASETLNLTNETLNTVNYLDDFAKAGNSIGDGFKMTNWGLAKDSFRLVVDNPVTKVLGKAATVATPVLETLVGASMRSDAIDNINSGNYSSFEEFQSLQNDIRQGDQKVNFALVGAGTTVTAALIFGGPPAWVVGGIYAGIVGVDALVEHFTGESIGEHLKPDSVKAKEAAEDRLLYDIMEKERAEAEAKMREEYNKYVVAQPKWIGTAFDLVEKYSCEEPYYKQKVEIQALQAELNAKLGLKLAEDGKFGPATMRAMIKAGLEKEAASIFGLDESSIPVLKEMTDKNLHKYFKDLNIYYGYDMHSKEGVTDALEALSYFKPQECGIDRKRLATDKKIAEVKKVTDIAIQKDLSDSLMSFGVSDSTYVDMPKIRMPDPELVAKLPKEPLER